MPRSAPCLTTPALEAPAKRTRRTVQSWAEANGAAYVEAVRILGPKLHDAIRAVMDAEEAHAAANRNAAAMAKEYQQAVEDCADAAEAVQKAKDGIAKIESLARSIADATGDAPEPEDIDSADPGPVPPS